MRPRYINSLGCLSVHSLCSFWLSPSHSPCSPSLHSVSLRTPVLQWLYPVSPRQLLQSDTGVSHFALDPLTYRCLLSLSPAADFAEPRPPRHIPPPPDSGRETLRLAAPPPPHFWRGSRLQSSASPACGYPVRWYPSCGGATARARGPNRG